MKNAGDRDLRGRALSGTPLSFPCPRPAPAPAASGPAQSLEEGAGGGRRWSRSWFSLRGSRREGRGRQWWRHPDPAEEVTHPENLASGRRRQRGGQSGAWLAAPLPDLGPDPRAPRPGHGLAPLPPRAPSPLGVGGDLAPHSEALPRFEVQVAGDQTLQARPHPDGLEDAVSLGVGSCPPGSSDPVKWETRCKFEPLFLCVALGSPLLPAR